MYNSIQNKLRVLKMFFSGTLKQLGAGHICTIDEVGAKENQFIFAFPGTVSSRHENSSLRRSYKPAVVAEPEKIFFV